MFFHKYIDPLLAPFRAIQAKIVAAKTFKGNIKVDVSRVKSLAQQSKNMVGQANDKINHYAGVSPMQQGGPQVGQQAGQAASAPGAVPGVGGGPIGAIRTTGFWFWKKRFCANCGAEFQDASWDKCPFCTQAAAPAPAKTQAFVVDASGNPSQMQLLGWIVPLQGAKRGELITLSASTIVGTDPACTVVLQDQFMSGRHAEIRAEAGFWVLRDLGSMNGTLVNNRRIEKHELVDNDFITFGSQLVKFKSL